MPTLSKLLERNRKWADAVVEKTPDFFTTLAEQQKPDYLWIGCSDSRIPANEIMGLAPGEVFVHRNIANMVVHTDMNLLSVLQYAVEILKVRHIIVTGHYGCGGVKAALAHKSFGLLDNWLQHIQDVENFHEADLTPLDINARFDRMCELNVLTQANNLRRNPIIQNAWKRGQDIEIHTWIYDLKDGHLQPLRDVIKSS